MISLVRTTRKSSAIDSETPARFHYQTISLRGMKFRCAADHSRVFAIKGTPAWRSPHSFNPATVSARESSKAGATVTAGSRERVRTTPVDSLQL